MKSVRFIWLAVFALFIGIASFLAEELLFPKRVFPVGSFEAQIHDDFRRMREQKLLPAEMTKLHEVFVLDHRTQKSSLNWKDLSAHNFPNQPDGLYDLQIEVIDASSSPQDRDRLQIIQFSLFDRKSRNKIWELNREYTPPLSQNQPSKSPN